MRCRERDFALEESTNSLIVREGRRPELDDDEELGQVDATADPGPDRRWLAVLVFEAITTRGGHEPEMTVGSCGRRRPYRWLPLVEAASRLLAVRNTLRTGVGVDSI